MQNGGMKRTLLATPMKPVDPMTACAGDRGMDGCEYDGMMVQQMGRPSTIPAKGSLAGSMMDGPYGGKKPQS